MINFSRKPGPHLFTGSIARIVLILLLVLNTGCGSVKLESHWQDDKITIDGDGSEWHNNSVYMEDPGAAIGIMNDSDYIYIALMSSDRTVQRQIMTSGLTIWFDVTNKKEQHFGIHFPLGMREMRPDSMRLNSSSRGKSGMDASEVQRRLADLLEQMDEFEIIGPAQGNQRTVFLSESLSVDVRIGRSGSAFVYELKVPINPNIDPVYALKSKPGDRIAICLESPEMRFEIHMPNRPQRGMPPGGSGGMGGGRGGGGGGMKGGGRNRGGGEGHRPETRSSKPFGIWTSVQLASPQG
jgi:uncharacterized membrane protein YgcG